MNRKMNPDYAAVSRRFLQKSARSFLRSRTSVETCSAAFGVSLRRGGRSDGFSRKYFQTPQTLPPVFSQAAMTDSPLRTNSIAAAVRCRGRRGLYLIGAFGASALSQNPGFQCSGHCSPSTSTASNPGHRGSFTVPRVSAPKPLPERPRAERPDAESLTRVPTFIADSVRLRAKPVKRRTAL